MSGNARRPLVLVLSPAALFAAAASVAEEGPAEPAPLGPLPALGKEPGARRAALGKLLFFDGRLSGDGTLSCASCHDPAQGFTDGLPLSKGYPGSLYFRNTPTVLNAAHERYLFWDGRLPGSDLATAVRDHISEAHFQQADGRLVVERLRQVPEYEQGFKEAFGGEPSYGRILDAAAAYLRTLRSCEVPFDRYLEGEEGAISAEAKRGLQIFRTKAGCIQCHSGPMLSDGRFHNLGLEANRDIFREPKRHITFRRFFKTLGVPEYSSLREDVGLYALTQRQADRGRFRAPSLREVSKTAPYMHDGSVATLEEVIEFYDRGGGPAAGKDPLCRPLGLGDEEKRDLVEFLNTLSGKPFPREEVKLPAYAPRSLGEN